LDNRCSDCEKVYFCDECKDRVIREHPSGLLECERCLSRNREAMSEYDENAERSEIGHREGGLDPYKNDEEYD